MSRLLVITSRVPYSTTEEAFVQDELEAMRRRGVDLIVVPTRLRTAVPNDAAVRSGLADVTVAQPLVSRTVLAQATRTFLRHPIRAVRVAAAALAASGSLRNAAANLAVVPKALWIAELVRTRDVSHVHAYWLAHTSTAAMIASQLTGRPWSGTGYRWDIDAANALGPKIATAAFLRVADELGQRIMRERIEAAPRPCQLELVRTGVDLPDRSAFPTMPVNSSIVCCAGAFVPKKGQGFLIEAVRQLRDEGRPVHLHLFGDGELRGALESDIARLELTDHVTLHGIVPLESLRAFLRSERPIFVLPSIKADDGQEEGIPVVLIEAMSNGCPVVSTTTGSIPTLVLPGCGVLVEHRDPGQLREAVARLQDDPAATHDMTVAARERVAGEFDLRSTAKAIAELTKCADPR